MLEKNKQVTSRLFQEVINQRNSSAIDELYRSDVVDHSAFPDQAPGTEGIKKAVADILELFEDLNVTVEDIIAEDDRVVFGKVMRLRVNRILERAKRRRQRAPCDRGSAVGTYRIFGRSGWAGHQDRAPTSCR